jgi:hypothetical protein
MPETVTLNVTSPSSGFASFSQAHLLALPPANVQITMTSGGAIWLDATLPYDGTYVYLHASDAAVTAILTLTLQTPIVTLAPSSAEGTSASFFKRAGEQFAVSLDFSNSLAVGDTIAGIVSVTAANRVTGVDATAALIGSPAAAIAASLTAVVVVLMGGAAGANYTISITITSSLGETYVGEILLGIEGGGYSTLNAVAAMFPTFVRNGPKGPADGLIQTFIDDVAAEINAALQRRFSEAISLTAGFSAWVDGFGQDQQDLLDKINRFGACGEMGTVFAATGQTLFAKLSTDYETKYQGLLRELDGRDEKGNLKQDGGRYDKLFDPSARSISPRSVFESFRDRGPRREAGIDEFVGGDWDQE